MAKIMLAVGLLVDYSYAAEIFSAFYSMDRYEVAVTMHRMTGAYAWIYWTTIACNGVAIQFLWSARVRASPIGLMIIAALVLIGMWFERFMLIVTTLYRDFVPSSWGMYYPTFWDIALLAGSVGLFMLMFLLFVRLLPVVSMFELRKLVGRHGGPAS
jgi:molybdopterin-containing oxidoreductase family membrane subunit